MDRFAIQTPKLHMRLRRTGTSSYPHGELLYFPLVIGHEKYCDAFLTYQVNGGEFSHVEMIDAGQRHCTVLSADGPLCQKSVLPELEEIARRFNPRSPEPVPFASEERSEGGSSGRVWRIPPTDDAIGWILEQQPRLPRELYLRDRLNRDIRQILAPIDIQGGVSGWRSYSRIITPEEFFLDDSDEDEQDVGMSHDSPRGSQDDNPMGGRSSPIPIPGGPWNPFWWKSVRRAELKSTGTEWPHLRRSGSNS